MRARLGEQSTQADTTSAPSERPPARARLGGLGVTVRRPVERMRRLVRGPGDPPGSPFRSTLRSLVAATVAVVAVVLAVVGVAVALLNARAAEQQTLAQLRYFTDTGALAVLRDRGAPNGGGPGRLVPYSPRTPEIFTVVLDANGTAVFDRDQVLSLGVPVAEMARPVLQGQSGEASAQVQAQGHAFQLYARGISQQGQLVGVIVAGTSLDLQQQQEGNLLRALAAVYAVVLAVTFLTSLMLTERALRPARLAFERQRTFAMAASHELRTPLAVIRSEAELVGGLIGDSLEALGTGGTGGEARGPAVEGHLREALGETAAVTSEVDYMTRMVQELLLLARDASDVLAHEWSLVDLPDLAEEVVAKVRPVAESHGLTLALEAADATAAPLAVRGDADLLRQLLMGLLENAVRYTNAGGRITVGVRAESHKLGEHRRHALLTIADTGIGIAPEHLPNIFEPFYRAVSPGHVERPASQGTGLGLALAQWIVRAHSGTIRVQSQPQQGTTFTVELPLAAGTDLPAAQ